MTTEFYKAGVRAALGFERGIFLPSIGQSGSMNGNQNAPAVDTSTPLPDRLFMFPVGVRALPTDMGDGSQTTIKVTDSDLGAFVDAFEKTTGGSGYTGMVHLGYQFAEHCRKGGIPMAVAVAAFGIGEGSYISTKFGTVPFNNLATGGVRAGRNFNDMGLDFWMPAVIAPDTEGNAGDGRAASLLRHREKYGNFERTLHAVDRLDIPRIMITDQSSGWGNQQAWTWHDSQPTVYPVWTPETSSLMAVLDASAENPNIVCVGPNYPHQYQDNYHLNELGHKQRAARMARSLYRALTGGETRPMFPTICKLHGGYSTVKWVFPMAQGAVRVNGGVSDPDNWGITTRNDENTMPGFENFTISGNTVYVAHGGTVGGTNPRSTIAMQKITGGGPNAGPRSPICDSDVDAFGYALPNFACHWAGPIEPL